MLTELATASQHGFDWVDIVSPTTEELSHIALKYKLHPALVKDCMQPDHLPKHERMDDYNFLIFRIHTEKELKDADSVQELTHKIAVFYSDDFLITIHRKEKDFVSYLSQMVKEKKLDSTSKLLNALIFFCLTTFEEPSKKLIKTFEYYEQTVFLRNKKISLLKGLYYLKRKVDLIKSMLILSHDIIEQIDQGESSNVNTRNTRDTYVRLQTSFQGLSDDINQLLNIYFSTSSQRTNEIMRVLTLFSVFFMPMTFIAGIYGMNFQYMPELTWKMGYPGALGLMGFVAIIIYVWFRKKGWL